MEKLKLCRGCGYAIGSSVDHSRCKSKPLFTAKHYKAIGEALKTIGIYSNKQQEEGIKFAVIQLCKFFKTDNPKFSSEKFIGEIIAKLN